MLLVTMRATLFHNPSAGHKADKDDILELKEWLASPLDETPPVTTRQGKIVELTWTDTANRLDDEPHSNRDTKQIAEVACEKDQVQVLVPVKHPVQLRMVGDIRIVNATGANVIWIRSHR